MYPVPSFLSTEMSAFCYNTLFFKKEILLFWSYDRQSTEYARQHLVILHYLNNYPRSFTIRLLYCCWMICTSFIKMKHEIYDLSCDWWWFILLIIIVINKLFCISFKWTLLYEGLSLHSIRLVNLTTIKHLVVLPCLTRTYW